jgi:hypothetical protein
VAIPGPPVPSAQAKLEATVWPTAKVAPAAGAAIDAPGGPIVHVIVTDGRSIAVA